jgi:eukaryotic-like serine/threonine-protein kinase
MVSAKYCSVVLITLLLVSAGCASILASQENTIIFPSAVVNSDRLSSFGDLLQYEWPQFQGDASSTRFSTGPAPDAPNIMWKTNIPGIQSYLSAFNSKVFVTNSTTVFALDKDTGGIIWNKTLSAPGRWPAVYKIDDTHMVVGNSCLETETGRLLWTSPDFTANAAFFADSTYSPEEKMLYTKSRSHIQGWNFSNPSIPPTLVWETYVSGAASVGSGVQYGDGKVFPGSFEAHQVALDAKTGSVIWDVETKGGMLFSGSYYQGKFFRGSPFDNTFYCFDADTGEILWTFNPGTYDGYWCAGNAVAYGIVYAINKDGYLYALDVNTGELLWKYIGPGPLFFPGYPVVADGKVYITSGQSASFNPSTGEYCESEFVCLDAYTGQVIWTLPLEAYPPRESVAIAYGNLYLIPGFVLEQQMDDYITYDQVWAIGTTDSWPMWRHDAANSATGKSGPSNLTLRWKFETSGAVVSSPSAVEGRIYFGSHDKHVYCIDAWSGDFIWKFETNARISSSPAVYDGKVYVGPDDGTVYCLDAYNGSLVWSTGAGGFVPAFFAAAVNLRSSPTVVDGKVYVGALDTKVYCLDAETGDINWAFKTEGYITSSPAVVDGTVYVTSQEPTSGGLYKLDASNGNLIRRIALPYFLASRGTDMHSSPTVAEGMIFAASNKQAYHGINATTGNVIWTFRDEEADAFIIASPVYHDGKVFLVDQFFIVAVDALTGDYLWQVFLGTEFYVAPTFADGKLYVTSDQRGMYVLNATDGSRLSWFSTPSNSWSSPTLYEGKVYVGNNDWHVYCLTEYPILKSNVALELKKNAFELGETVTGCGLLVPGIANVPIMLSFVKPNDNVVEIQVETSEKGYFEFSYTPDLNGIWNVYAEWRSDRGYYSSAFSETMIIEIVSATPPPTPIPPVEWFDIPSAYIIVSILGAIAVVILGYVYIKRKRTIQ